MQSYDADRTPDPKQWLELDEQARIHLVEKHHRATKVRLPNAKLHSVIHVLIENQIALQVPAVVAAMERLSKQGLSRHDCVHAVGSVVAEHLCEWMVADRQSEGSAPQARLDAALDRLDAATWLAQEDEEE